MKRFLFNPRFNRFDVVLLVALIVADMSWWVSIPLIVVGIMFSTVMERSL